eukprot:10840132-Karenia_brevis.AAC.1
MTVRPVVHSSTQFFVQQVTPGTPSYLSTATTHRRLCGVLGVEVRTPATNGSASAADRGTTARRTLPQFFTKCRQSQTD